MYYTSAILGILEICYDLSIKAFLGAIIQSWTLENYDNNASYHLLSASSVL